jgi:hypothetical protein
LKGFPVTKDQTKMADKITFANKANKIILKFGFL